MFIWFSPEICSKIYEVKLDSFKFYEISKISKFKCFLASKVAELLENVRIFKVFLINLLIALVLPPSGRK
jgi:hypothetical protein